jgi:hypothetical protein
LYLFSEGNRVLVSPVVHTLLMRRATAWRLLPLAFLVALVAVLGLAAARLKPGSDARTAANVLWGVIPTAAALWQYSFSRFERHRLWVNRMKYRLSNPESSWGLTAEFDVAIATAFTLAEATVDSLLTDQDHVLSRARGATVWQVSGLPLRLMSDVYSDGAGEDVEVIRLEFLRTPRAFRSWPRLLSRSVVRVVEAVDHAIVPEQRRFTVEVDFKGDNPYFGLFVSNVQQSAVARFEIDYFTADTPRSDVVQVRRDKVRVLTDSLTAARDLSLHYLALRPAS